jgi:hypothetical protein
MKAYLSCAFIFLYAGKRSFVPRYTQGLWRGWRKVINSFILLSILILIVANLKHTDKELIGGFLCVFHISLPDENGM